MRWPPFVSLCAVLALLAAGCGGSGDPQAKVAAAEPVGAATVACKYHAGWQKLADRIGAPVYCPNWLPDPLIGAIGGRWNNIDSVDPDRSYLESWVWQETGPGAAGGELHVNLRGYPGTTTIPTCEDTLLGGGKVRRVKLPCFSGARGARTVGGIRVQVYTVGQGADQWHVTYAWRRDGGLYTASEHVAPPLDYAKVVRYLDRIVQNLVVVEPAG